MPKWSDKLKTWEQQPEESSEAFEAFSLYLQLGIDRSYSEVAQRLHKSKTLIGRWGSRWKWQERVHDYNNFVAETDLKKMRQRQTNLAKSLQLKAAEALNQLQPDDLSPNDIIRFISVGAELEKQTRQDEMRAENPRAEEEQEGQSSLADVIAEAYNERMGGQENT